METPKNTRNKVTYNAYMNEYMKEYRKTHDEKIKCDVCGYQYSKINKSHHYKTNRHELADLRGKLKANV
jgi:hypothetical protein